MDDEQPVARGPAVRVGLSRRRTRYQVRLAPAGKAHHSAGLTSAWDSLGCGPAIRRCRRSGSSGPVQSVHRDGPKGLVGSLSNEVCIAICGFSRLHAFSDETLPLARVLPAVDLVAFQGAADVCGEHPLGRGAARCKRREEPCAAYSGEFGRPVRLKSVTQSGSFRSPVPIRKQTIGAAGDADLLSLRV